MKMYSLNSDVSRVRSTGATTAGRCWNSVFLDGAVPEDVLRGLCDRSQELEFGKLLR